MKYKLTIEENPGHFEVKTEGKAEISGFKSFLNEIFNHPQWEPGMSVLLDHSDLVLSFFRT